MVATRAPSLGVATWGEEGDLQPLQVQVAAHAFVAVIRKKVY